MQVFGDAWTSNSNYEIQDMIELKKETMMIITHCHNHLVENPDSIARYLPERPGDVRGVYRMEKNFFFLISHRCEIFRNSNCARGRHV